MKTILIILTLISSSNLFAANDDELKELYSCFNIKNIKVNEEYDKIQWSPNDDFMDVCTLSFRVSSNNLRYIYLTRRWRSPSYCKKFLKEWNELKKESRKICIAGYLSYPEKVKYKNKEVLEEIGYWEVIKSENWCHTYFMGNCQGIPNSTESF